jgi:hypothetical protein
MENEDRVRELLQDAKKADEEELRELVEELGKLAMEAIRQQDPDRDLAVAVRDFAEWQHGGYEDWNPDTRNMIAKQLWYEVSDRVCAIIGSVPEAPSFGSP